MDSSHPIVKRFKSLDRELQPSPDLCFPRTTVLYIIYKWKSLGSLAELFKPLCELEQGDKMVLGQEGKKQHTIQITGAYGNLTTVTFTQNSIV